MLTYAGYTSAPAPRSMLTAVNGFQTFLAKAQEGKRVLSLEDARSLVRELLHRQPAAAAAALRNSLAVLKDKSGCVIDVCPESFLFSLHDPLETLCARTRPSLVSIRQHTYADVC
jgi:hypothetical protein